MILFQRNPPEFYTIILEDSDDVKKYREEREKRNADRNANFRRDVDVLISEVVAKIQVKIKSDRGLFIR